MPASTRALALDASFGSWKHPFLLGKHPPRLLGGRHGDTRSVLEHGIELWNAHDREGWVSLFDETADLQAPGGMQVSGRSGAELFYDTWNEAFPENAIEELVVFDSGEQGAEEARFTGTHSGTLHTPNGDIPPTGNSVVSQFAAVVRVHDNKVTSFHIYFDVAEVLVQLGLME